MYSVVTGTGANRSRRAYRIGVQGDTCTVHNGRTEMTMPFDLLMLAVRSLCGLEDGGHPVPGTGGGNIAGRQLLNTWLLVAFCFIGERVVRRTTLFS